MQSITTTTRRVQAIRLEITNRVVLKVEILKLLSMELVVVKFWIPLSVIAEPSSSDKFST